MLRDFWENFSAHVDGTKELRITDVLDALNVELGPLIFPPKEDGSEPRACPRCGDGQLSLKLGKFGSFVGCSNYPDCGYTRQLGTSLSADAANDDGLDGPKELGTDPATGEMVTLRSGRFGPYVQRGEGKEAKRSSLPKGWEVAQIDFEAAQRLLSLPRDVGPHPDDGEMITAGLGRYGPFVKHGPTYANVEDIDEVFSVGLNRAVTLIAEKKEKRGGGRGKPAALATLGEHPTLGGEITVRDGRFGPYVNTGKVNATLPKGKDPASVTLEDAIQLLTERAEKTGAKGTKSASKAKKAPAKKAAASKSAKSEMGTKAKTAAKKKPAAKPATKAAAKASSPSKAPTGKGSIPEMGKPISVGTAKSPAASQTKASAVGGDADLPWDAD